MSKQESKHELKKELVGLLMITFSLITAASLFIAETNTEYFSNQAIGAVGGFLVRVLAGFFGDGKFIFPIGIAFIGFKVAKGYPKQKLSRLITGLTILYCVMLTFMHLPHLEFAQNLAALKFGMDGNGGGVIGAGAAVALNFAFGQIGSYIVLTALIFISLILTTNLSLIEVLRKSGKKILNFFSNLKEELSAFLFYETEGVGEEDASLKNTSSNTKDKKESEPIIIDHTDNNGKDGLSGSGQKSPEDNTDKNEFVGDNYKQEKDKTDDTKMEEPSEIPEQKKKYSLPSFEILNKPLQLKKSRIDKDISEKVKLLEQTLENFGIKVKVNQVSRGPVITRYELQPAKGVKVSKIVNLSDDISLSLAAPDVRIEAPIPGKSLIGIEVPNKEISTVYFREVLENKEFLSSKSQLPVALGKDISGNPVVTDLREMPHLLVAGATGSGKSVCINALIASLLFKNTPDDLKLLIVDPKRVEMINYNGIPHLISPVVTEAKKAASSLRWMVREMEYRYELFAGKGVRDIDRYNQQVKSKEGEQKLPYLVVLIDELADLMMVAPADVEDGICRLAQMARAAGIHLVVATQRPSVDIITGLIKANIPSRISFAVSSQTDSRTILDMGGAEKLLGHGDMLFHPVGAVKPMRIQGAFISDREVGSLVNFFKTQGAPQYEEELIDNQETENNIAKEMEDELLPEAVKLCITQGHASISLLQRRLHIGYTRAARLIDIMEQYGYVGPYEGSKPRNILITWEQFEEQLSNE